MSAKPQIPEYNSRQLDEALKRLGFKSLKGRGNLHKWYHPTFKQRIGITKNFIFSDDIGNFRGMQEQVVKRLCGNYDELSMETIISAIKGKKPSPKSSQTFDQKAYVGTSSEKRTH